MPPPVDQVEGVVRVSLVHYHTLEEVEEIIKVFKEIFA